MKRETRLPIKVVLPSERDFETPSGGGGEDKVFATVDDSFRRAVGKQLGAIEEFFAPGFEKSPGLPAVARVSLRKDALAKSHRPIALFNSATCPIIGGESLGQIFISVTRTGLKELQTKIRKGDSKKLRANISTLESIEPYTVASNLGAAGLAGIESGLQEHGKLKLKLFSHGGDADARIFQAFSREVRAFSSADPIQLKYAPGLRVFRLEKVRPGAVQGLARFVGTQSLGLFPRYQLVRTASQPLRRATRNDFPTPEPGRTYPSLGIVDSGINPEDPLIGPWVIRRHAYHPEARCDHDHGTFVAGLAVHARSLNNSDPRFPDAPCKLVDVVALPGSGSIAEDDLLEILEEVIPQHPKVKYWNLSLATPNACSDQAFSDLAIALDDIQDRYGVTFVIAAGNFATPPFRAWPPEHELGDSDRISIPADSVRAVAVGSLAHVDRPNSRVRSGHPSPFTRRGPGPVFLPKPELVHFGGNCDERGNCAQTGVLSLDGHGRLAEDIGTSFATPLVASTLSNVHHAIRGEPSRTLVKALAIQAAVMGASSVNSETLKYTGFGVPGGISGVVTCEPWSATLIFEPDLIPGRVFVKNDFPIPPCLRLEDGRFRGEIFMTLVYNPPLEPAYGAEYCRVNVEVSLGSYDIGKDGKRHQNKLVPEEPHDISEMYEEYLVKHGFKWSPIKVFHKKWPKGVAADQWRLTMEMHGRSGYVAAEYLTASLIVSIVDPLRRRPVYDEVVRMMSRLSWPMEDLRIRERVRLAVAG